MSYVTLRCYNTCYVIFWCKSRCMRTFERHRAWVEAGERGLPDCSGSMVGEGVGRKARRGLPSVTNYFLDTPFRRATVLDRVPFALTGARQARTLRALLIQRQPGVEARSWSFDQKQPACFLSSSGRPMGGRTRGGLVLADAPSVFQPRFGRPPDWKRMCDVTSKTGAHYANPELHQAGLPLPSNGSVVEMNL